MVKMRSIIVITTVLLLVGCNTSPDEQLAVNYAGDAGLEVGGPYVGLAFHHSAMIPQRISLFYPVANSIDHSRDYWTRDTSFTMDWELRIDEGPVQPLGRDSVPFEFTPYAVTFTDERDSFTLTADYRFCQGQPAVIQTLILENTTSQSQRYRFDYRLKTGLRTCHTFKIVDDCRTVIDEARQTVFSYFDDPDTKQACVFVISAGAKPVAVSANSAGEKPYTALSFDRTLAAGERQEIVLIIGSALAKEAPAMAEYLVENYSTEVRNYEQAIEKKIFETCLTRTGDLDTDHSVAWAKAVMEANQHYLDGELVPMPCPAEYNFYFTHDALVTDLAAVQFDLARVKRDLTYIINHADENKVIPHAYYWKDGKYVTEFASSDNWNNFWLIQVAASYLRHSGDVEFARQLYPYVAVSLERALLTREDDNLMWSSRPDWWDIGHNYGPRAYMTILAIKAIQDYIYLSATLEQNLDQLTDLVTTSAAMREALTDRLWNPDMGYLVNYHNDGSLDEHYYIGSLLAAYFNLLDDEKADVLVNTARQVMVDEQVGIYNAWPMDFEEWGAYLKFVGNEAGAKYYYFNGGIWPQGNAWYALALIACDRREEAAAFIDRTMSMHGIWEGPNGQPAYYEVRNANRTDPAEYGRVDKPQFLWAGGWYLYSLYNLFGVRETSWNIALEPYLDEGQQSNQFRLFAYGGDLLVTVTGQGSAIAGIKIDGQQVHSAVLPGNLEGDHQVDIHLGKPQTPYLAAAGGQLEACALSADKMEISLSAYTGYANEVEIVSPIEPREIWLDDSKFEGGRAIRKTQDYYRINVSFNHSQSQAALQVLF